MNLLEKNINKFKLEFHILSKETNKFYSYLITFITSITFCFMFILTRNFIESFCVAMIFFGTVILGMKKIYNNQKQIFIEEEMKKLNNRK